MKKIVILTAVFCALLISAPSLFAQKVNTSELSNAKKIKFRNYTGRYDTVDPKREVRAIGRHLARESRKRGFNRAARYHRKYYIIPVRSKNEPEKFDTDIFVIDRNARVSHVKYIQHMVSGYLQYRYGYRMSNADTLALFIVYYNAAYRGNLEYFSSKYKSSVMKYVTKNNVGIDTYYKNWPGRTRILIPLTYDPKKGDLGSIDPTALTDKKVREAVRKDDKNLPERKKMVELQEDKIEKEKKEIKEEKKDIVKEKEKIEEKKKEIKEEKKDIAKKEETIKKEKEEAKKIKDPEKKKEAEKKIAKKEEEVKKEKEEVKKEEKKTQEAEKTVAKKEEEVKKKEDTVAKKEESVKEQKKEIAKDELKGTEAEKLVEEKEKELAKKEEELKKKEDEIKKTDADKAIIGDKLYYLKTDKWIKNGYYNNELFMINAATMKVMKKSPVENIGGKKYIAYSEGIVVITHKGGYANDNHLTLIDKETLEGKTTGKDRVFWRSFIELNQGFIYVVVTEGDKYYLGKFDGKLNLVAKSKEEVSSDTFISFFKDKIYINSKDKDVMVLKNEDLSLIGKIQP